MKAIKLASSDEDRTRLMKKCNNVLARAEEIKRVEQWVAPTGINNLRPIAKARVQAPISRRTLSRREEIILLESSKLHGFVFPQWISDPKDDEFEQTQSRRLYTCVLYNKQSCFATNIYRDSSEMKISEIQRKTFAGWKRPDQALYRGMHERPKDAKFEPTMLDVNDIDLVQDITADCSVVASLCAAEAQRRNGHENVRDDRSFHF